MTGGCRHDSQDNDHDTIHANNNMANCTPHTTHSSICLMIRDSLSKSRVCRAAIIHTELTLNVNSSWRRFPGLVFVIVPPSVTFMILMKTSMFTVQLAPLNVGNSGQGFS